MSLAISVIVVCNDKDQCLGHRRDRQNGTARTGNWTKVEVAMLSAERIKHSSMCNGAISLNIKYGRIKYGKTAEGNAVGGGM